MEDKVREVKQGKGWREEVKSRVWLGHRMRGMREQRAGEIV
jgi:hypothetical protein